MSASQVTVTSLDAATSSVNGRFEQVDLLDVAHQELGAEALRLRAEALHQVGAEDALGEPGIVLDVGGVDQLPARRAAPASPSITSGGSAARAA